jgi:hypothetical protein
MIKGVKLDGRGQWRGNIPGSVRLIAAHAYQQQTEDAHQYTHPPPVPSFDEIATKQGHGIPPEVFDEYTHFLHAISPHFIETFEE